MQIRLASDLTFDSIVDGAGLRTVVWTQGCLFNCYKCHNPQTHDPNGGKVYEVSELVNRIVTYPLIKAGGVTFSGGDPFYQLDALLEFTTALKKHGINIWAYSGDVYENMLDPHNPKAIKNRKIFENLDVLVDGPYVDALNNPFLHFRGSNNQRLIDVPKSLKAGHVVLYEE